MQQVDIIFSRRGPAVSDNRSGVGLLTEDTPGFVGIGSVKNHRSGTIAADSELEVVYDNPIREGEGKTVTRQEEAEEESGWTA